MNSHDLARQLLALPDMPVVVAQEDEPLGSIYGVTDVSVARMKRDDHSSYPEVWETGGHYSNTPDPRTEVCYLGTNEPFRETVDADVVDAEVVEPADMRLVDCPSCGNDLEVSAVTLPGDQAVCSRCQQIVTLPPSIELRGYDAGPGWQAIMMAAHRTAIDNHDRDTRILAGADQARAELTAPPRDFPSIAGRFPSIADRCFACNRPSSGRLLCGECLTLANRLGYVPPFRGIDAQ